MAMIVRSPALAGLGRRAADRFGTHHTEGCHSRFHARIAWLDKHVLTDLRTRISALAPQDVADSMEKVTLSRFSLRSFIAIALLVVAVYVVFTQIQPAENDQGRQRRQSRHGVGLASRLALWRGLVPLSPWVCSWIPIKRNTIGLYCSQMASGFTAVSMPAGVGPAFVNLQYLRKSGYRSTAATAVMSAVLWPYREALPSCCC